MEPNILEISFHWPHNRFCFGWQLLEETEEWDYHTFELFLGIVTITYNHL